MIDKLQYSTRIQVDTDSSGEPIYDKVVIRMQMHSLERLVLRPLLGIAYATDVDEVLYKLEEMDPEERMNKVQSLFAGIFGMCAYALERTGILTPGSSYGELGKRKTLALILNKSNEGLGWGVETKPCVVFLKYDGVTLDRDEMQHNFIVTTIMQSKKIVYTRDSDIVIDVDLLLDPIIDQDVDLDL